MNRKYFISCCSSIFLLLAFAACSLLSEDAEKLNARRIEHILYTIPEVKNADRYLKEELNVHGGVSWVGDTAETKDGFAYISVGHNGEERFETYFHLRIHGTTKKVEVQDLATDSWQELQAYRRKGGDSSFHSFVE